MRNIILLGPPGSGKGTQGSKLSKEFNIPVLSTGDALRKEVSEGSKIGLEAKKYMDSGDLVPDEVVLGIVKNRISQKDCDSGFILDGFPRNSSQAQELEVALKEIGKKIDIVFNFEIDDEEVVKRISGRFFCQKCQEIYNKFFKKTKKEGICDNCGSTEFSQRKDDNEETIRSRLKVYHEQTSKLIEFYEKKDLIFSFNAVEYSSLILQKLIDKVNNNN